MERSPSAPMIILEIILCSLPSIEKEILTKWEAEQAFEKSVELREGATPFVFYEGPPSANGMPGIHHVISRTLKDLVCRYKTMQGFHILDNLTGRTREQAPLAIASRRMLLPHQPQPMSAVRRRRNPDFSAARSAGKAASGAVAAEARRKSRRFMVKGCGLKFRRGCRSPRSRGGSGSISPVPNAGGPGWPSCPRARPGP